MNADYFSIIILVAYFNTLYLEICESTDDTVELQGVFHQSDYSSFYVLVNNNEEFNYVNKLRSKTGRVLLLMSDKIEVRNLHVTKYN